MAYPRVTEILKAHSGYDKIPTDILNKASDRGQRVHGICANLAKDMWIPESMIEEEYLGYVTSFKLWSDAQVKKHTIIEKRFFCEDLCFSGQVDMVVVGKDDELHLVDLKTTSMPMKTHPVQMAAYKYLLQKNYIRVKDVWLVYLNKAGEFPEVHVFDSLTQEFSVFMSALECYNYFNQKKGKTNARTELGEPEIPF